MDKTTFLSKIKGKIDGSKITLRRPPVDFGWWLYASSVWMYGKTGWDFAVGIVFRGQYFGCDAPSNPPVSSKCIVFYDINDAWVETQDETICNNALAALPTQIDTVLTLSIVNINGEPVTKAIEGSKIYAVGSLKDTDGCPLDNAEIVLFVNGIETSFRDITQNGEYKIEYTINVDTVFKTKFKG